MKGRGRAAQPAAGQLALPLGLAPAPAPRGPTEFRVGGRTVHVSACFDTFWQFAAASWR